MPNDFSLFAVDDIELMNERAFRERGNWRLLKKLEIPEIINYRYTDDVDRGIVIDVETTGLSTLEDEVVQIAILPFTYDPEFGLVLEVDHDKKLEALREPSTPMSEEASLITGITDEMLKGQSIDAKLINSVVDQADLIIAHNANFDRPMVEKLWPVFKTKPWSCSLRSVDWLREGYSGGKLDYLGMQFGWFYDGHRALADCEACLALLAQDLPNRDAKSCRSFNKLQHKRNISSRLILLPSNIRIS
jgi:DNA polymerase-3 subunit epsilon